MSVDSPEVPVSPYELLYKVFNDELLFGVFLTLENNPSLLTPAHALQFQTLCLKWETEKENFEQEYEDTQWSYPSDDNLKEAGEALVEFCNQPDMRESARKGNRKLNKAFKLREAQAARREANPKSFSWWNLVPELSFSNILSKTLLFFATVNSAAAQQLLSKSSSSSRELGKFRGRMVDVTTSPLAINLNSDIFEEVKKGPLSKTIVTDNCIFKVDAVDNKPAEPKNPEVLPVSEKVLRDSLLVRVVEQKISIAQAMISNWDQFEWTEYYIILHMVDKLRRADVDKQYVSLCNEIPSREVLAGVGIQIPPAPATPEVMKAFNLAIKDFDKLDSSAKANFFETWAAQGVVGATLRLVDIHHRRKNMALARLFARLGLEQAITESVKEMIAKRLAELEPSWVESYASIIMSLLLSVMAVPLLFSIFRRRADVITPAQPVEDEAEEAQDAEKKQGEKYAENLATLAEIKQKLEKIVSAHEQSQKEEQEKEAEKKKKNAKLENIKKNVKENKNTIIALRSRVKSLCEVLEKEKSSKQRNETLKHYGNVIAAIDLLGIKKNYVLEKHDEIIKAYALLMPALKKFKVIEEKESSTKAAKVRDYRKILERLQLPAELWGVRALSQQYFSLKGEVKNYAFASEETREGFTLACNEIMKQCSEFEAQVYRMVGDDELIEHVKHVRSLRESLKPDQPLCKTVEEKRVAMINSAEENSGKKAATQKISAVQKKSSPARLVSNSIGEVLRKGELKSEFPGKTEVEKNPIRAALYWRRADLAISVQDEADFKTYRLLKYRALQYRLVRFAALLIKIYENKNNPAFEDCYESLPEWFKTRVFKNFAEDLSNGLMHGYFVMSDSQKAFEESNDPDGLFKCVRNYIANQEYELSRDVVEEILCSQFGEVFGRAREVEQCIALKLVEQRTALELLDDCIAKFTELKENFDHFKDKFTEANKLPVYRDAQKRLLIIIGEVRARLFEWYPEVLVEEDKLGLTTLKDDLEKYRMARNSVKHDNNSEQAANPFVADYISDKTVEKIERNALSHIKDLMTIRAKVAEFSQLQEVGPAKYASTL